MRDIVSHFVFCLICIVSTYLASISEGAAQAYPAKPLRLIVSFPAGGVPDVVGRVIAQALSHGLGQSVVVDNRAGASGTLGVEAGAKAPADGYTLTLGSTGTLASAPGLFPGLGYDPIKSFSPISLLTTAPFVVVIHPSLPANSLKEFIAFAKRNPGQLNYGSVGSGSPPHIAGEMFKTVAGVDIIHVPYKGLPTAITDLLTGRIQILFNQAGSFQAYVHSGKLRALAVADANRVPILAGVPTAAEAGLRGFEVSGWFGLLAPAGTPGEIVGRLNAEVLKALALKEVRDRLIAQGFETQGSTPQQFSSYIVRETAKWSSAIKVSGAKLD